MTEVNLDVGEHAKAFSYNFIVILQYIFYLFTELIEQNNRSVAMYVIEIILIFHSIDGIL